MSQAKKTRNHREIQQWVEERGGKPATVTDTAHKGEHAGLLRIDFPDNDPTENLEEISWDDFFQKFDESKLAFLHQDEKDGQTSRFCKFVSAEG